MLLLTALIWGAAFVAQSVGMDYVGPFTFNGSRFIIGGVVLIPCIFLLRAARKRGNQGEQEGRKGEIETKKVEVGKNRKEAIQIEKDGGLLSWGGRTGIVGGICCGLCLCVASTLQQIGITYTTAGKAGFITALYIIIVPILGLFFGKKAGRKVWISVVIAASGFYFLSVKEGLSVGYGEFLVFLCAIVFSAHILVIDYFSPKADGVFLSCVQFFTAGIICWICAFLFEKPMMDDIIAAWKPVLYAGIMSCGVAYTLQVVAQKDTDPTVAALILSLESVFSALSGWIILHQAMSRKELLGCGLVFIGIILAQIPDRKSGERQFSDMYQGAGEELK